MKSDDIIFMERWNIYFLDVVRGLKSEAEKVSMAFEKVNPQLLAMSVSPEEIDGLREYIKEPFEVDMSRYEELYAERLAKFGDVFLPPPCFLTGLEESDRANIDSVGVDMDDESHTAAYCAFVSGTDLFRHSTRFKFIKLRRFKTDNPAEFALEWDRVVNGLKGFRQLEREREKYIADELRKHSRKAKRILALVDVERAHNVRKLLVSGK